jgi:sensor histidine kinase YesM
MNKLRIKDVLLNGTSAGQQVKEILLIAIGGGLFQGFLLQDNFLTGDNYRGDLLVFSWSACNWLFLWKGNEYMVRLVDHYYSWLENPAKRFLVGLSVMLVYTVSASLTIYSFFFGYILGRDFIAEISSNIFEFIAWPIGITGTIVTFAHSRAFLLSWRQTAINAERLKQENITSKYESLKNQVNPHFLFNSLNALSGLVYEDQAKAVSFIRKLSDVYRYVLIHKEQELVSLQDELKFMENYTYLQKIRFDDNLIVNIHHDQEVTGWVPPLAIQLLVENAIKHNTVSEAHPLTVDITISKEKIVVSNTIREKLSKDSTGIGLQNIKDRYRYLSDQLVTIENDGHIFKMTLPMLNVKNP